MDIMSKRLTALAAAILTLGLSACSGSRHEAAEKYYLVVSNTRLAYWQTARAGLAQAGHKLGVAYDMVGPDSYDPQAEIQAFRDAVSTSPSGILVSAADPNGMKDQINAAIAKGIPVMTIDSDVPASKRLTFIGTKHHQ